MRRNTSLCVALFILLAPLAAHAATSAPGVNLRWDACYADGGVMYKTFACDTNVGLERLLMSFELAEPKSGVTSIDFVLTVASASPTLPSWWSFRNAETCRQTAASLLTMKPTSSPLCISWSEGQGTVAFAYGNLGAMLGRFVGTVAAAGTSIQDLEAGVEYFLAMINITHQKSVGMGACTGCEVPVCLTLDHAWLNAGTANERLLLNQGANWPGSRVVGWQGGYASSYVNAGFVDGVFYGATLGCVPYSVTASKPSTWGQVKALYR